MLELKPILCQPASNFSYDLKNKDRTLLLESPSLAKYLLGGDPLVGFAQICDIAATTARGTPKIKVNPTKLLDRNRHQDGVFR